MLSLLPVDQNNYRIVCALKASEEQKAFAAPAIDILARAYAMRDQNARAYAIDNDGVIVGVALIRELGEESACYDLNQLLIDSRYQSQGYDKLALKLVMELLMAEAKYNRIDLCVKKKDEIAIRMYQNVGFLNTGYTDPEEPDAYVLTYSFDSDETMV